MGWRVKNRTSTLPDGFHTMPRKLGEKNSNQSPSLGEPNRLPAAPETVTTRPQRLAQRPTKQASYELANHAKAYLEGGQSKLHWLIYCNH